MANLNVTYPTLTTPSNQTAKKAWEMPGWRSGQIGNPIPTTGQLWPRLRSG